MGRLPYRLLAALCVGLAFPLPGAQAADGLSGKDVYRQTLRATARVSTPNGAGTGWLLDRERRLLVTNYHVVGDQDSAEVTFPAYHDGKLIAERTYYRDNRDLLRKTGHFVTGRVLSRDPDRDLALLELAALPDGASELPLAADSPDPGETVHSIGNRRDLEALWEYTAGSVCQVYRTREGYPWQGMQLAKDARIVVLQMPVLEGDSGGPVVNDRGELVAVAAAVRWQSPLTSIGIDVSEVRAFVARSRPREQPRPAPPSGGAEVYRRALAGMAWVQTGATASRPSGCLIDRERRLLLTSCQALGRQEVVKAVFPVVDRGRLVAQEGRAGGGCVLARDARRNLALVELDAVPNGTRALRLAADSPAPGERVHLLDNRGGAEALWLYTRGAVRQVTRAPLRSTPDEPAPLAVVAQLPPHDENAGGPLLDDRGEVVGITTDREAAQQELSYAADVSEVRAFLAEARPLWQPGTVDELRRRAALYLRTHRYECALADWGAAVRLDPHRAPAYADRGEVRRLLGDRAAAVADCDEALRLDPRLVTAYCHRAAASSDRGDQARAVADCTAALRLDPKCALAHARRGNAHRLRGDAEQALADCDRALGLDPNLAEAYFCRGLLWRQREDLDRAAVDFTRAVEFDPLLAAAYRERGDVYRVQQELKSALADYDRALELAPDDALACLQRGLVFTARGDRERALTDFTAAVRAMLSIPTRRTSAGCHRPGR
jgi:tetratricopeptide (TPR) repeat protein